MCWWYECLTHWNRFSRTISEFVGIWNFQCRLPYFLWGNAVLLNTVQWFFYWKCLMTKLFQTEIHIQWFVQALLEITFQWNVLVTVLITYLPFVGRILVFVSILKEVNHTRYVVRDDKKDDLPMLDRWW